MKYLVAIVVASLILIAMQVLVIGFKLAISDLFIGWASCMGYYNTIEIFKIRASNKSQL